MTTMVYSTLGNVSIKKIISNIKSDEEINKELLDFIVSDKDYKVEDIKFSFDEDEAYQINIII